MMWVKIHFCPDDCQPVLKKSPATATAYVHDLYPYEWVHTTTALMSRSEAGARPDQIQDYKEPPAQKKVLEALWLLVPEAEEVVASRPRDDY